MHGAKALPHGAFLLHGKPQQGLAPFDDYRVYYVARSATGSYAHGTEIPVGGERWSTVVE